jgi:hypothetical protein
MVKFARDNSHLLIDIVYGKEPLISSYTNNVKRYAIVSLPNEEKAFVAVKN